MAWWRRRSFKLRLTLWYAFFLCLVLAGFFFTVYEIVEHRLEAEVDRQLRIDFDLLEAQLERDAAGRFQWTVRGAHGDEGFARLSAWFEVWSADGMLLLRHWPVRDEDVRSPLGPPSHAGLRFYAVELESNVRVRLMERPGRVVGSDVAIRMFRDESAMRRTLGEILEVFWVTIPFAVFIAAGGGYVVAQRSLRRVSQMAQTAQKITSESLSARLPNPNPSDEFGELATVFNDTLTRLERSFLELKRFTADASHELRTPLTALRAVGEVALSGERGVSHLRETIGSMLEESQRLDTLIESLLTLARLEGDALDVNKQPVDVSQLLRDASESLLVLASQKSQTLAVEAQPDIKAQADPILLRQSLLNIIHNAIRYAPSGTRITLRVAHTTTEVGVSISDEGPGIGAEHIGKIFTRFYRVDKSRSRPGGGYGLGLAIAKWSVERQGGRLEVDSSPRGSTFTILMPRAGTLKEA